MYIVTKHRRKYFSVQAIVAHVPQLCFALLIEQLLPSGRDSRGKADGKPSVKF